MKKILALLFSVVTLAASAQWGRSERVTGNGDLKKETRSVGNFKAVASAGSMNVQLAYGKPGSVTVEADGNLLEYIETKVENNTLKIGTRNYVSIRSSNKITVYVTVDQLEGLSVAGSGNIDGAVLFCFLRCISTSPARYLLVHPPGEAAQVLHCLCT